MSDVTSDGAACRATQARLEPGHATLEARLDLGYDSFGSETRPDGTSTGWTYATCPVGCSSQVNYQFDAFGLLKQACVRSNPAAHRLVNCSEAASR